MPCTNPISLPHQGQVPCGKCLGCQVAKQKAWSFRIMKEVAQSTSSLFVTLTYDDEHLSYSPDNIPVVSKRDVQLWLKRLRKHIHPCKVRYFLTSEYGTKTLRPHYHVILFNLPNVSKKSIYETIVQTWQLGFVTVSPVTRGRAMYVAKYTCSWGLLPSYYDRKEYKPFLLCSRRPGIGLCWLNYSSVRDSYRSNPRGFVTVEGGHKIALPRYYKTKLYDDEMLEVLREQTHNANVDKYIRNYETYRNRDKSSLSAALLPPETEKVKAWEQRTLARIKKNSKL